MRTYFRIIKRWDVILIISLILLSFLPLAIFSYQHVGETSTNTKSVAVISVDNKEVKRVELTGNQQHDIFDITQPNGDTNTIEVSGNRIRIKAADCPDQVCVLTSFISKPGKTIVCLPHKLVIEIQTVDGKSDDLIISS
ncbi:NusG domain II-containing protein [Aquibacillus rhizosphaerae]|uniref:NusG domain II-containing protein n=1 Tax=Aquibacillus rhizosphaerae TaxID=3051431 RepID=A0ABT7L3Q2_9BACI|nr:NusG domain II-containing protein [Aquibacillus sp. LR5S19]MDL4840488.1 NusG domain II-containing protein [Aquibacillus sp. LR5S19]